MSWVKDIVDASRDLSSDAISLRKIRRSLLTQCRLNDKLLRQFYKSRRSISTDRMHRTVERLDIHELEAALNCGIPFGLITRKKVTAQRLEKFPWKAYNLLDNDLEALLEKVYLMAAYLKKDHDNPDISVNNRLVNLYKYNVVLIDLLK